MNDLPPKESGPLLPDQYRCAVCGEILTRCGRSHEEKLAEEKETWGFNATDEDRVECCEDCFIMLTAALGKRRPAAAC